MSAPRDDDAAADDLARWFASRSRELVLAIDGEGRIRSLDDRAAALLGPAASLVGQPLASLAAPGTEAKLEELARRGRTEELRDWEAPVVVRGRPVTLSLQARPHRGGVALLASLHPEETSRAVAGVSEAMQEVVSLNREVVRQKRELSQREQRLRALNEELVESNRGVLALHAELEDRAGELRLGAEVKTRLVANVSHEFRTPLHSILGLAQLLLGHTDGPLTDEQETQVRFIRAAAQDLSALVNDMLDIAKLESGNAGLRLEAVPLDDLAAALRGSLRPLVAADSPVELRFDPAPPVAIETDRGKLSQVLRNLVSNALKFTERGSVRVAMRVVDEEHVAFDVVDTGIGIAADDLGRIFEEFAQIESALQSKVKGTGLGLPLSRRLAEALGGTLTVESQPGVGSTFTLTLPRVHPEAREMRKLEQRSATLDPARAPVLVVEDDRRTIFLYERYLANSGFQVLPARSIDEARRLVDEVLPAAIVLDIMLENETSWRFLAELKSREETRDIPVLVVTVTDREQKARALGADEFWLKPLDEAQLLRKLRSIATRDGDAAVLTIDDDPAARYLVRRLLTDSPYRVLEASDGAAGVEIARAERPDVILLDFMLQGMTAFDVLDQLKADPTTRAIPVIVVTSHVLQGDERRKLAEQTEAILSKEHLSRELAIHRIQDALHKAGVGTRLSPRRR